MSKVIIIEKETVFIISEEENDYPECFEDAYIVADGLGYDLTEIEVEIID